MSRDSYTKDLSFYVPFAVVRYPKWFHQNANITHHSISSTFIYDKTITNLIYISPKINTLCFTHIKITECCIVENDHCMSGPGFAE